MSHPIADVIRRPPHASLLLLALALSCGDNFTIPAAPLDIQPGLAPVAKISLSPTTVDAAIGHTLQFIAVTEDSAGNTLRYRVITWTSSDTTVATVDTTGVATWVGLGAATITASCQGASAVASVTVRKLGAASVIVQPPEVNLVVGQWMQFAAAVRDTNDSLLTGRAVSWASSDSSIATVDNTGRAVAAGIGVDTIIATAAGATGAAILHVVADTTTRSAPPPAVASVTVTPAQDTVVVPHTLQLVAVARDQTGATMANVPFTWSSSAPNVASVSPSGFMSGLAAGSATIAASAGGESGTSRATVLADTSVAVPLPTSEPMPTSGTVIWHDDFDGGLLGQLLTDVELLANYTVFNGSFIHSDPAAGINGSGAARIDWQRTTTCQDADALLERGFAPTQEVYAQYYIRYTPGFIFDWTDSGQSPCEGNAKKLFFFYPASGSGTARFEFISENHTLGMGGDFDHPLFQQTVGPVMPVEEFGDGSWHRVTIHVKQSSAPNTPDGFIYGWIDGVLRWAVPNWASGSSGGWNYFQLPSTFNQGSPADQSEWLDDLTIWKP